MLDRRELEARYIRQLALKEELYKRAAERSLYEFYQQAWPQMDPAEFSGNWHLQGIAEHLEAVNRGEIKRLVVNVPPRSSKPVCQDERVWVRGKGDIPLREVVVGDEVWTHRQRWRKVLAVHEQGALPVKRLITEQGRTILAEGTHPFLTPEGWREVGMLAPEDVVGISSGADPEAGGVSLEEARLLGYLIGDGRCAGTPNITCGDETEAADIRKCIEAVGFTYRDTCYSYTRSKVPLRRISVKAKELPAGERRTKGYRGPVRQWMEARQLDSKDSYTKFVPECIFRADNEVVANFLGAYWACDGHIAAKGAKKSGSARTDFSLGCASVSNQLLLDIQLLLTRFGISSNVRRHEANLKTRRQGDTYVSYTLDIRGMDNAWRFLHSIPVHHTKFEKLRYLTPRRSDFDRPIYGEVVRSVQDAGTAECRCLTVEEDSSFTVNGFIVHNTKLISYAWPSWTWLQDKAPLAGPQVGFIFASYALNLSLEHAVGQRRLVKSPWYQERWGERFHILEDQDKQIKFENDVGGHRTTTSVDGTLTGRGADILCCLAGDSVVETDEGPLTLREIVEDGRGSTVRAFDGSDVMVEIGKRLRRGVKDLIELEFEDGTLLHCTPDHLIMVVGRGWVAAGDLREDDEIAFVGGLKGRFTGETSLPAAQTYDIEVPRCGNFYANGVLVHNCDDPHNVVDAESKTTREGVIKWFREALPSRLNNQKEGAIVVVMQRVHEEDVSGAALEMGYEHLMIPMEFDEGRKCVTSIGWEDPRETDGELMWPEKFPRPVVERLKTALDSYAYAGQYQQAPTPRGGGIIKREWWNEWENPDPNRKNHFPKFSYVVASLDPAYTEKQENDYSAFSLWGVFHESEMHRGYNTPVLKPKVMLIWAWRDRLPLHELVQKVHNDCVKYRADTLLVEAKASGISVQQEMRRMFSTGDYGIQMINPRGDKVARVQAISHFFYDGMVYAPPKRWAQAVVDQVSVFPKGAHDDDVDAMSQALLHLRQTGVLVRKEEAYTAVDNEAREPVRRVPLYPC